MDNIYIVSLIKGFTEFVNFLTFTSTGYHQLNVFSGAFDEKTVAGETMRPSPATILVREMHLRYVYWGMHVDENVKKCSDTQKESTLFSLIEILFYICHDWPKEAVGM